MEPRRVADAVSMDMRRVADAVSIVSMDLRRVADAVTQSRVQPSGCLSG